MQSSAELRAQAQRATTRLLRLRHYRLTRTVERFQAKLAIVDEELAVRGVVMPPHGFVPRRVIPGLRYGEIAALCMEILRRATRPLRMREIVTAIADKKGYDPADTVLKAKVTERTGGAMERLSKIGAIRKVGAPTSKLTGWTVVQQ